MIVSRNDIIMVGEVSEAYTLNIIKRKTIKNKIREAINLSYSKKSEWKKQLCRSNKDNK